MTVVSAANRLDIEIDYSDCVTTGHETGPQNNSELGNLEIE